LFGLRPFWICLRFDLPLSYQISLSFCSLFRLPFSK
jgi:hypothetical protein